MVNPRRFTNLLYHFKGKVGKKSIKDKTIVMIRNQSPFMDGLENVKKYGSCRSFAIESSSPHPHILSVRDDISGNTCICICGKKHLIPNTIAARNLKIPT